MERIILAFPKDETIRKIQHMLDGTPYTVVSTCHTCADTIRLYLEIDDAIILMSHKLIDGTCDDVFESLPPKSSLLALTKAEMLDNIRNIDIFTVLMPINRASLVAAMDTFYTAFIRSRRKPVRKNEDKEIIQKAKFKLMETYRMDEEQAHRFIQKRSMDNGMKALDTAKLILNL